MTLRFEFSQRDAANRDTAKRFIDVLLQSERFARNEKGSLCFLVKPGDWCPMHRRQDFAAVLLDGGAIELAGDTDEASTDCMWFWASQYRWKLPRVGGTWNPDKPLPVRNAGQVRR